LNSKSTVNSTGKSTHSEKDPNTLINKVPQVPSLKMPNKDINATTTKLKILQFKNIPENIQDMIANALIQTWKKDFALKKISTYVGVKNFILHNFKDKLNSFFKTETGKDSLNIVAEEFVKFVNTDSKNILKS